MKRSKQNFFYGCSYNTDQLENLNFKLQSNRIKFLYDFLEKSILNNVPERLPV